MIPIKIYLAIIFILFIPNFVIIDYLLFPQSYPQQSLDGNLEKQKNSYIWPVKGIRAITGTFGEYRNTHFHMGMDFSTGGKKGLPIVSVAKGKIIKVQRYWTSIGNAVIVEHEDGMQARYGHLSKFSPALDKLLKSSTIAKTYKSRRDFDYTLENPIAVEQGEIIAYSGDTGVGPPHLHFELFKNGIYYNPRDFGLGSLEGEDIVFLFITIRPETNRTFINGKHEPLTIPVVKEESAYILDFPEKIFVQGVVSIQLSGYQKNGNSRLGLQQIQMEINQNPILKIQFKEIPKNQTQKFVLMYDAYQSKSNGDPFLYNLYSMEGNGIHGLGDTMVGSGLISSYNLSWEGENKVSIIASGLGDQVGELYFSIYRDHSDYSHIQVPSFVYNVKKDRYTSIRSTDRYAELFFPTNSVFIPAKFEISELNPEELANLKIHEKGMVLESKVYKITPEKFREFNLGYDLYIRVHPKTDLSKCGLFEILPNGKIIPITGANISLWGKYLKARLKKTGTFAIFKDETPPQIELVSNYQNGHVFQDSDFEIVWQLKDEGTGFDHNSVHVTVDGERGIAEIHPHTQQALIVEPSRMFEPGEHKMEIYVYDKVGNRSETKVFQYIVNSGKIAAK